MEGSSCKDYFQFLKQRQSLTNIFGKVKLGRARKLWHLLLHNFWLLVPSICIWKGDWALGCLYPNVGVFLILATSIIIIIIFSFYQGFSFIDTDDSQDSSGRAGTIFYSTLPLPPADEHSDIYLQLCTWDDYHIFLIATLVFTRLLLDEIYHLIELLFDWLMMWH